VDLEQLYLSHNGVARIEGLEHNVKFFQAPLVPLLKDHTQLKLTTLDIGANYVPAIENLTHLTCLEELWVGTSSYKTHRLPYLSLSDEWKSDPRSAFSGTRARLNKESRDVVSRR
jgi:hypothetical protein